MAIVAVVVTAVLTQVVIIDRLQHCRRGVGLVGEGLLDGLSQGRVAGQAAELPAENNIRLVV